MTLSTRPISPQRNVFDSILYTNYTYRCGNGDSSGSLKETEFTQNPKSGDEKVRGWTKIDGS